MNKDKIKILSEIIAKEIEPKIKESISYNVSNRDIDDYVKRLIAEKFSEQYIKENYTLIASRIKIEEIVNMASLQAVHKVFNNR